MSKLLPEYINEARHEVLVADSLRIPTHPNPPEVVHLGQLNTREELATYSNVLEDIPLGEGGLEERIAFVDKAHPHGVHDFMGISAGETVRSSLYQHSDSFIQGLLRYMHGFASLSKERGLSPVVAWSYDPDTKDRASGQGEKRFHAHFIGRSEHEIENVHRIKQSLGNLAAVRQRRIADEFSVVVAFALYDLSRDSDFPGVQFTEPLTTPQSKLCLQFEVENGWQAFTDTPDNIATSLRTLDQRYKNLFRYMLGVTTTGEYGTWQRPSLQPDAAEKAHEIAQCLGLQTSTASLIEHYIANLHSDLLQPEYIDRYMSTPRSDWCTYLYPLGGLSYTTCLSEIDGKLMGHFRANMFTDLGGAGVSMVDGIMTKVTKACGPMTEEDYKARQRFQTDFVADMLRS